MHSWRGLVYGRMTRWLVLLLLAVPIGAQDSGTWRSALYPEDWTPAFTDAGGRFLHDFSYAGYRRGEEPIPNRKTPVIRVPRGEGDRTAAIQSKLDAAAKRGGGVVLLPEGLLRVDGMLTIRGSGIVLRGAGAEKTRLRFTKSSGLNGQANLMARGTVKRGPDLLLAEDARNRATVVTLQSVEGLRVGDHVALGLVIDDAFRAAHGMQKYWKFAAGKWRALFRREVTAIDAKTKRVTIDTPLRYPLKTAHCASLRQESGYLEGVGIEDLSVCNAIDDEAAWKATRVHAIELRDCRDSWVRRVRSFAAEDGGRHLQSGGMRVRACARITVSDCQLARPQHRGGGGNGYLFEVMQSSEVLTVDCKASEGRHNFIANWDLGTSGCVWLRCHSEKGRAVFLRRGDRGFVGLSEFHHALAMACLVDNCRLDDGWKAANRLHESSGAGHTATEGVFWRVGGHGVLRCHQFGVGYIIGTGSKVLLDTKIGSRGSLGTEPEDFVEGLKRAVSLRPMSLYEDQLRRRRSGR